MVCGNQVTSQKPDSIHPVLIVWKTTASTQSFAKKKNQNNKSFPQMIHRKVQKGSGHAPGNSHCNVPENNCTWHRCRKSFEFPRKCGVLTQLTISVKPIGLEFLLPFCELAKVDFCGGNTKLLIFCCGAQMAKHLVWAVCTKSTLWGLNSHKQAWPKIAFAAKEKQESQVVVSLLEKK